MVLVFYDKKTAKELESYDKMTSIDSTELNNIKRKIEEENRTESTFKIK